MVNGSCLQEPQGRAATHQAQREVGDALQRIETTRRNCICPGDDSCVHIHVTSSFKASRDGEGIIVQWLTSGKVLVVFFTFDQNGDQLWLIGIETPNGNSVTMEALYPSSFTQWGRNYSEGDTSIDSWGTFTLTWTDCNTVSFGYTSTVTGFGNATHEYTRLSSLQDTVCPAF